MTLSLLKNIARGSKSPVSKAPKISDHPELVPRTRGQTLGDARAIQRFLEQNRTHRPGSADSRITAVGINAEGSADKRITGAGDLDSGSVDKRNFRGSGSADSRTTGVGTNEGESAEKRLIEAGALDSGTADRRNCRGSGSADSRTTGVGTNEGGSADKRLTEAGALYSGSADKRNVSGSRSAAFRTTGVRIGEERSADKRLTGSDGVRGSSGFAHKKRTETLGPGSADKRSDGFQKIRGSELADLRTVNGGNSDTGPVVLNVESDEDQSDMIIIESSGRATDVICLKPASADGSKRRSTHGIEENACKKTK